CCPTPQRSCGDRSQSWWMSSDFPLRQCLSCSERRWARHFRFGERRAARVRRLPAGACKDGGVAFLTSIFCDRTTCVADRWPDCPKRLSYSVQRREVANANFTRFLSGEPRYRGVARISERPRQAMSQNRAREDRFAFGEFRKYVLYSVSLCTGLNPASRIILRSSSSVLVGIAEVRTTLRQEPARNHEVLPTFDRSRFIPLAAAAHRLVW